MIIGGAGKVFSPTGYNPIETPHFTPTPEATKAIRNEKNLVL
jgi:hypothetical protein